MVKSVTDRTRELIRLQNDYIKEGDLRSAEGIRDEILSLIEPLTFDQRSKVLSQSREQIRTLSESAIIQDSKTASQGLSIQMQKLKEGQ
jgi:hypothetical protein